MKNITLSFIFLSFCCGAHAQEPLNLDGITVRELTNAQIFRSAREQFLKGDYVAAQKAFEHMLKLDCENRLAQYHLRQIADKGPQFTSAAEFLDGLPCKPADFSKEGFLPSSIFYEKDPQLLLEQIRLYNERIFLTEASLAQKVMPYAMAAADLDQKVKELTAALEAKEDADAIKEKISQTLDEARSLDSTSAELRQSISQDQILTHNEIAQLQEHAASLDGEASQEALKAIKALNERKLALASRSRELAGLQARFALIGERLLLIERFLSSHNQDLETLRKDLEAAP